MNDETIRSLQEGHADLRLGQREHRARLEQLAKDLKANTEATARVEANTKEMVIAFTALQGTFVVMEFAGKVGAKFLLFIAVPGAFFYGAWQAIKAWALTGVKP